MQRPAHEDGGESREGQGESSGEQRKEGAGDVENGDVDVGEREEM